MTNYEGAVFILCILLVIIVSVRCVLRVNEIDKRIDSISSEEKRQNKRIDILEKREQMRQLEQRKDQTYIQSKDLFKDW